MFISVNISNAKDWIIHAALFEEFNKCLFFANKSDHIV